ncbi:MAG: glucokinase [Rhodocyclaceae bacterium]|nr:glucokinase [Rhodocyclaceae bacterium]MCB1891331.1 glucokinase [Rhodocyclaceae bacterium]PKO70508.1 MAG: glucokinase [Betaproteobacteria bacterium HGW-Betaproteobacteria-14]
MILGGDIGGTKTLLALAGEKGIVFERRYPSSEWGDFPALLRAFLDEAGPAGKEVASACFGVAGPVEDNCAKVTYLPWTLDGPTLSRTFSLGRIKVINDFAAAAQGVAHLHADDLVTLQEGHPLERAPRLLVGAGTGLGVAALVPKGSGWRTVGGEGGHIGFAPASEEQLAVWRHLLQPGGRVTAENVISGPGLAAIYASLRKVSPGNTAIADPAEIVAAVPANPLAGRALDLFIAAYGAFAGDLALLFMARGGVYIGGGIAPKILPRLQEGGFVRAFRERGAHAGLMSGFPIRVITNERLGLLGALTIAAAHTNSLDSHQ